MSDFSGLHSYQFFSLADFSGINEPSFLTRHPHAAFCGHWKTLAWNTSLWGFRWQQSWLCAKITIYSPPVTVTMVRRGRALSTESSSAAISPCCLHISPLPWRPVERAWLHCASDMPEGATWCAFLPHYGFHSAVSEAVSFGITDPLARLNHGTCRGTCKHTEHKVSARWEIPASGVCGIYQQWGANCLVPLKSPPNCPTSPRRAHTCVKVTQ